MVEAQTAPPVWQPWADAAAFPSVTVERCGAVVKLTMDNPRTLNSLTRAAFSEIPEVTKLINADPTVRVLLLTGAGRAFSSGADVKEFLGARVQHGAHDDGLLPDSAGRELPMLRDVQIPVIAGIHGAAAGAGFVLALLADFRIATTEAFFVESHVARGLTPSVSAWLLPSVVGMSKAAELVLLGRRIGADDALRCGLVNQVVAPGRLDDAMYELAQEICALPAFAVRSAKGAMRRGLEHSLDDVREWAGAMEALSRATTDELRAAVSRFAGLDQG